MREYIDRNAGKSKGLQFDHPKKVLESHNPNVKFYNFTIQSIECSQFSTQIKLQKCDHPNENQQKCCFTLAPQNQAPPTATAVTSCWWPNHCVLRLVKLDFEQATGLSEGIFLVRMYMIVCMYKQNLVPLHEMYQT